MQLCKYQSQLQPHFMIGLRDKNNNYKPQKPVKLKEKSL